MNYETEVLNCKHIISILNMNKTQTSYVYPMPYCARPKVFVILKLSGTKQKPHQFKAIRPF